MHRISAQSIPEEAVFSRFHAMLFLWCFLVLVLDGYDLAVAGIALPSIMKDLNVSATTAGIMASFGLFGMMFGAMMLGVLADRLGRRLVIAISVCLFSFFTAAAGLCNEPISFSAMRFLAGVGLGSAIPNVMAHMTEYSPRRIRNLALTAIGCGYPVGSILAALVGKQFIETQGWQFVFLVGGVPLILVPLILKNMPESLAFLIKNNDRAAAAKIIARLHPGTLLDPSQLFLTAAEEKVQRAPVGGLFRDGRGVSSIMFCAAFFMSLFMLYALSTWLVKLMTNAGYSLGSALTFLLVYNVGAAVGAASGGWLADRYSMKRVLVTFYLLSAASLVFLGYGAPPIVLFVLVAIAGASSLGSQILLYAYAGQFYPTLMRSTGLGFTAGIGRAGAIAAPVAIGVLVGLNLQLMTNFIAIAIAGLLGAIAVSRINDRISALVSSPLSSDSAAARIGAPDQ